LSERCCLIERDERGDRIRAVRLIGQHADALWTAPRVEGRYADDAGDDADAAAEWITERLAVDGDKLGLLIVDTSGAQCAWVHAAAAEANAVRTAFSRGGEVAEDEFDPDVGLEDEAPESGTLGSRPTPMEASIEPLGPAHESATGVRVGVLVSPDAVVRLLIDALDRRGVDFTGVTSLWHALGWAASPHAETSASSRVVADSPTVSCGVLVQSDARLVWSWCREGAVLAAGSQRLGVHDDGPIVTRADVARLINDWVAWSAQLGIAPDRVLLVSCPLAWEGVTGDPETMTAPGVASALAELWPEAVMDVQTPDDALVEVVRQSLGSQHDSLDAGHALSVLARRPGRGMRRVYQLVAIALAAAGLALAALGYRWQAKVEGVRADAAEIRQEYMAEIAAIEEMLGRPGVIANDLVPMLALRREVDQATRASQITRAPARPVMRELESLSFLLGELGDRVDLQKLEISSVGGFTVQMVTEDVAIVGDINRLLNDLDLNSGPLRWTVNQTAQGSRYTVRMGGIWQRQGGAQ
jgi:hypothetical protein